MRYNLTPSNTPAKGQPDPKGRAGAILRAYIHSPSGQAAEGIFRALATLDPLPTFREAAQLTEKIPTVTQSRALNRFSALLEARDAAKGCADGGRGHYDPCECPRKPRTAPEGAKVGGKDWTAHKPPQALITPDRPQPAKDAEVSEEAREIQERIKAESQGRILDGIQAATGLNREIAAHGYRIFNDGRAHGAPIWEIERKLAEIIPPGSIDNGGRPLEPWLFHLSLGLAPMVIGIHQRERYAREVHQGIYRGGMSEEEKTELIGEIIFGEHGYTAHRRKLEATKWRAGEDFKVMMGEDPEDPASKADSFGEGGAE